MNCISTKIRLYTESEKAKTKEGKNASTTVKKIMCSVEATLWREVGGGVAALGLGKREGPAGDKLSRLRDDDGYSGRVRSGAKRNGAPRPPYATAERGEILPPAGAISRKLGSRLRSK